MSDFISIQQRISDLANSAGSSIKNGVNSAKQKLVDATGYTKLNEIAQLASDAADKEFPNQKWDNTQRNAARHAIWMALTADQLGGGSIARGVTKGLGYAHEGMGILTGDNLTNAGAVDMRHDLNNNAVGLNTLADLNSKGQPTRQQIIDALLEKARQSKIVRAPSVLAPDIGVLSRGE